MFSYHKKYTVHLVTPAMLLLSPVCPSFIDVRAFTVLTWGISYSFQHSARKDHPYRSVKLQEYCVITCIWNSLSIPHLRQFLLNYLHFLYIKHQQSKFLKWKKRGICYYPKIFLLFKMSFQILKILSLEWEKKHILWRSSKPVFDYGITSFPHSQHTTTTVTAQVLGPRH